VVLPRYDEAGFAALPATVERLLGSGDGGVALPGLPERAERVVLVLLDAFGWRFFSAWGQHPLLARMDVVVPLVTQFPATTSAHITTMHTGRTVGEHGLYEWNVYDPGLDALVTPLLFSFAGDRGRDTLKAAGARPEDVLPSEVGTIYQRLAAGGVDCHCFHPAEFAPSTYDGVLARGARVHAMADLAAGMAEVAATLRAATGPIYAYVYWPEIDTVGHMEGPSSQAFAEAVARSLVALEAGLLTLPEGTVVLLTADHGQVDVDPARTIFVNQLWPELESLLRHGRDGRVLAPAGSARDLFLHVGPGAVDEVVDGLRRRLGERADVRRVDELQAAGWFGSPGARLRACVGDVCVLALEETVWWRERGRFGMPFRGHHGALSDEEARTQVAGLVV
jgi:type I phosphodiesterase/nucleotide pyrophosphatase